jgi:hypothetical protein
MASQMSILRKIYRGHLRAVPSIGGPKKSGAYVNTSPKTTKLAAVIAAVQATADPSDIHRTSLPHDLMSIAKHDPGWVFKKPWRSMNCLSVVQCAIAVSWSSVVWSR